MTVGELIEWFMDKDIPLDTPVEPIHPALCGGMIQFRTGCNQSTCHRVKQAIDYAHELQGLCDISIDEIVKLGKSSDLPEHHKNTLRRLWHVYKEKGFKSIYK